MSPKKQSTASKKARQRTREGEEFITALRAAETSTLPDAGHLPLPPGVELVDEQALCEGERMVVEGLRALAAEGRPLPVRVAEPGPEVASAQARAEAEGRAPRWERWASVEAAVDGYVLREVLYGPNRSDYSSTSRGPRVPVLVRAADGTVSVLAMPEWARLHEGQWIWVHTGWPLECPGQIVEPPQQFLPAPELRWEVAVWHDMALDHGVLGEDYAGSASRWQTVGWCTSRADAVQIARAYTAHRDSYARADVLEHGPDAGVTSLTTDTFLPAPGAPERPRLTAASGPRPASPDRSEIPEPFWHASVTHPPNSSLLVWTGTGWRTLVRTDWQTRNIAAVLGIGANGPYTWAED